MHSDSEALTDIDERAVQSDEDGQEAKECEGPASNRRRRMTSMGDFRTACLEAGWTPVGQAACSQKVGPQPLDYTAAMYAVDHSPVSQARPKQSSMGRHRIWSCQRATHEVMALVLFLPRMSERWAVTTAPRQAWLEDRSPLMAQEAPYLKNSVTSIEASQRKRAPYTFDPFMRFRDGP